MNKEPFCTRSGILVQLSSGLGGKDMSRKIELAVVLVAVVMVTMAFAGCVGDGDDAEWNKPTQVALDSIDVNEANETVTIVMTLGDKDDLMTRASGTIRIAIWDSKGFEMLNNSFDVKAKDFDSLTILGIKISQYSFEIPFSDFHKSHDRGYDILEGDNAMHGMIWFTHKEETFEDTYDLGWLNPTIPEALLLPNEDPQADLLVHNPGYVGMAVVGNASASFDPEEGMLSYEWDWGDGDVTSSMVAEAEESHIYDLPGTYTITLTVTDPEDANHSRSMDVTIEWSLDITVSDWGIVADGMYVNQTYVELLIENMAPAETATPSAGVSGIMLKNDADEMTDPNGTDVTIPGTLAEDGSVTVVVYFDPVDGFAPTKVDVWGRELALP
ncbi:MAG: PKD domain-containing protein [Thermoplasmata archaeon]|nr:MAG: PKD domain-containing protein [Thermoplasmata archaeon]